MIIIDIIFSINGTSKSQLKYQIKENLVDNFEQQTNFRKLYQQYNFI